MILRSEKSFDLAQQRSTFTWYPLGAPRTLEYIGGRTTIPAQDGTIPLQRFEWVAGDVLRWIADIQRNMSPPNVGTGPIEIVFEINTDPNPPNPPASRLYDVYLRVMFPEFGNGASGFEVTHPAGSVILKSEHAHTIGWTELKMLNELYMDIARAARTSHRD